MAALCCRWLEIRCQCGSCGRSFTRWMGRDTRAGPAPVLGDRGHRPPVRGVARAPGRGCLRGDPRPRARSLPARAPRPRVLRAAGNVARCGRTAAPGRFFGPAALDRVVRRLRRPRHPGGHAQPGVRSAVPARRAHAHRGRGPRAPNAHGGRGRPRMRRSTEGTSMNETAVITGTDLDRLAERVERAARLITELRTKATRLEEERNALQQRLNETEGRLQGQDPGALMTEIAALRKEQRDWLAERREVTTRIEAISAKLERLE